MNNPIKPLIVGLVVLAGLFYMFAIIQAGIISIKGSGTFNDFFGNAVTVIGGVLATNLGAVLGISISPPTKDGLKTENLQQPKSFLRLRSSINEADGGNPTGNQKMQILACYFYVISLVIALAFWLIALGKHHEIIPLLPELSKTLLGVIVGALTVSLGRR